MIRKKDPAPRSPLDPKLSEQQKELVARMSRMILRLAAAADEVDALELSRLLLLAHEEADLLLGRDEDA